MTGILNTGKSISRVSAGNYVFLPSLPRSSQGLFGPGAEGRGVAGNFYNATSTDVK